MQFSRRIGLAALCTLGLVVGSPVNAQDGVQPNKLLPNDTEMVLTINFQQILKSEVLKDKKEIVDLVKAKIAEGIEGKGMDKYLKTAGFDIFTDLNSMTFAVPGGRNPEEGFIIIDGNFDADKIEAAVRQAGKEAGGGVKIIKVGNIQAYEVSPQGEKSMYVGILNKKTMIACAAKADFTDAVARFNGAKPSKMKPEFKNLLQTVNSKQSLSIVATSAVIAKMADNAPEGAADKVKAAALALQQIDALSLAVTIQKDVDVLVGVNAKDAKTATDLAAKGNLLIGLAKVAVQEKAKEDEKYVPAVEVLNSIRVTSQTSNLVIRGQISYESLGKLLANLPIPKQ